jgi:23S rRNA (guanosine2251-2'-O)-methyltransferase
MCRCDQIVIAPSCNHPGQTINQRPSDVRNLAHSHIQLSILTSCEVPMGSIIAGRRPVMEALRAGTKIEKIVFLQGVQGNMIDDLRALAERNLVQVTFANKQSFRELATDATTQGVVAIVQSKDFMDLEEIILIPGQREEKGFLLVLDEIEDPQNLGALVRTAECAGVHGVIIPKHHAATVTTTVIKTSAGATEFMPMTEVTNIVNTLEKLKGAGYWIIGLDGSAEKEFTDSDFSSPTVIVVGNEGRGMRRLVKEHCDQLVRIPLFGRVDSLNASVAGGLAMYEVARQRSRGQVHPRVERPHSHKV